MPDDLVILVDLENQELGTHEKLDAHRKGLRHRAVSGFIFNHDGQLLLQRRALNKYHCGGLWANTCCSHPAPGESSSHCMERRFREELGLQTNLKWFGDFSYRVEVGGGMIEDEFVNGFCGILSSDFEPNPNEVSEIAWISPEH